MQTRNFIHFIASFIWELTDMNMFLKNGASTFGANNIWIFLEKTFVEPSVIGVDINQYMTTQYIGFFI